MDHDCVCKNCKCEDWGNIKDTCGNRIVSLDGGGCGHPETKEGICDSCGCPVLKD